ncbi:substrate import-associated zinc metallohydrolase lipoprotein [Pedobacter psychrodurus]|uniref:substrate import-associated zinc metallohydrolase lipoprotein n=1 Tax=Pedobacter psychrodurus TaxID=2530456 RepID=UPI00292EBB1F|nr:substrate import-associated zinc metallohydrolase lipoprotein [Pedobacter psychrodurus]
MKKNIFKIFAALFFIAVIVSCRKEDPLNVDFSKLNIDNPVANTPLDTWLTTTFLNEYNIDVIYRYNRFYHGDDRDVAAVKVDKVQPQMQTVLEGFLLPYRKVAGVTFIKKYAPKQFVLFGSGSYNPDNSYTLATAAAGRNITIYDLNSFDLSDPNTIVNKLRTIHHEFTHILNQIVPMPVDFQLITKSTYLATWTTKSDESAQADGYVTPYASSQPGEDFAETTTSLLVYGQAWYDDRANGSTAAGKIALKAKEASVEQYFTVNLGIDFRALQREIQEVVRNTYNYQQASFPYWLGQNLYKSLIVNAAGDPIYSAFPLSTPFSLVNNNMKTAIAALPYGLTYNFMKLNFTSSTAMDIEINFNQGTRSFISRYAYTMDLDQATGQTKFTIAAVGGNDASWVGNANLLRPAVQPMLDYLSNNTFVADWLPTGVDAVNYNKYGGFYVLGTPANNFYGLLGQ